MRNSYTVTGRRLGGLAALGDAATDTFGAAAMLNTAANVLTGVADPATVAALQSASGTAMQAGQQIANAQYAPGYFAPGGAGTGFPLIMLGLAGLAAVYFLKKRQ